MGGFEPVQPGAEERCVSSVAVAVEEAAGQVAVAEDCRSDRFGWSRVVGEVGRSCHATAHLRAVLDGTSEAPPALEDT